MWAYLIWNFEPTFGQQTSILDFPYIGLFGPSWSELSPDGSIAGGGGSVGPTTYFFVADGQKRDYLSRASRTSRASQRARGAAKKSDKLGLVKVSYRVLWGR